jgi:hypothetical protein
MVFRIRARPALERAGVAHANLDEDRRPEDYIAILNSAT